MEILKGMAFRFLDRQEARLEGEREPIALQGMDMVAGHVVVVHSTRVQLDGCVRRAALCARQIECKCALLFGPRYMGTCAGHRSNPRPFFGSRFGGTLLDTF